MTTEKTLQPDDLKKELEDLKGEILKIALEMAKKGAGYAQQAVVLRAVESQYGGHLKGQDDRFKQALPRWQFILTGWHELFRDGELSWGYDLDNPDSPFFHVPLLKRLEQPVAGT